MKILSTISQPETETEEEAMRPYKPRRKRPKRAERFTRQERRENERERRRKRAQLRRQRRQYYRKNRAQIRRRQRLSERIVRPQVNKNPNYHYTYSSEVEAKFNEKNLAQYLDFATEGEIFIRQNEMTEEAEDAIENILDLAEEFDYDVIVEVDADNEDLIEMYEDLDFVEEDYCPRRNVVWLRYET